MTRFMGTHLNRVDAKGRVSVPAPFRAALRAHGEAAQDAGAADIILRPSHTYPCIEGWPAHVFHALAAPLDRLDLFSDQQEDMAAAIYASAMTVEADREGRIVLPETLARHAQLKDAALFMGLGRMFQIWEPGAGERRLVEARGRARSITLPAAPAGAVRDGRAPGAGGDA